MKLNSFRQCQDVLDENTFDSLLKSNPFYPILLRDR